MNLKGGGGMDSNYSKIENLLAFKYFDTFNFIYTFIYLKICLLESNFIRYLLSYCFCHWRDIYIVALME